MKIFYIKESILLSFEIGKCVEVCVEPFVTDLFPVLAHGVYLFDGRFGTSEATMDFNLCEKGLYAIMRRFIPG